MPSFLREDFLLHTRTARTLYHDFAEPMPIFDYHCHLPVTESAEAIYTECSAMLRTSDFSTRRILERMHLKVVCTTDDPVDTLEHHLRLREDRTFPVKVLPAFRPDKALGVESPREFNIWVERLEASAGLAVENYDSFLEAIRRRHDFFHQTGGRLSDHGIEHPFAVNHTANDVKKAFEKARQGKKPTPVEALKYHSAVMLELARMDAERGWVQQFHLGALRNINSRAMAVRGPDTGYDTIGDWEIARALARFLDRLDREERLAKSIGYVMNARDNEAVAAAIGCFQDGSFPGKMQLGSAWWFNDQKDGIEKQINALSNLGLLSRFVGMLTDSRSFLSYPRHEYFRRVLCNLLGNDVENGELPDDRDLIGGMVRDICFRYAVAYFGIEVG
jgi:glucuronate isomerase